MDAPAIKEFLRTRADDDLPEEERLEAARACLTHVGSPDPELRDELIYTTLARWIVEKGYFSEAELRDFLHTSLDDQHLFFCLGDVKGDSVFTRSFSSLIIACVLERHRKAPFLEGAVVGEVKAQVTSYLSQERDVRGYVEGKGWAHAVAHAADVLDELVQCHEIDAAGVLELLSRIRESACTPLSVYTYDEEERLAYAAVSAFERLDVADESLEIWIRQFEDEARRCPEHGDVAGYRCFVNLKHFLRALYFELERRQEKKQFLAEVGAVLDLCYRLQTGQEKT